MQIAHALPHDYPDEPRLRDLPRTHANYPRLFLLAVLRGYQKWISPGIPANTCRYYPSCSHYAYQAIYKYGARRGIVMGAWRLLRCNPFVSGGVDPVP